MHTKNKQETHGSRFAHLSKTAIAYLQMPCNILPVLTQQLGHKFDCAVKRSKVILGSSGVKKVAVFPLTRPTLFQTPDSAIFIIVGAKKSTDLQPNACIFIKLQARPYSFEEKKYKNKIKSFSYLPIFLACLWKHSYFLSHI